MSKGKKVLTQDEIIEISKKVYGNKFLCSTTFKDWTRFVCEALNVGVSQMDLDYFIMSDEDFDQKYP